LKLKGNPQAQAHRAAVVDSFLGEATEQASELVIASDVIDRIKGQQLTCGLIHSHIERTEPSKTYRPGIVP